MNGDQEQIVNIEGHAPIRRSILQFIRIVNLVPGRNGKKDRYATPSPMGLLLMHHIQADFKTGVCNLTDEQWAEICGCSVRSIRRSKQRLIQQELLIRLHPNRPDVYVFGYEKWNKLKRQWEPMPIPKILRQSAQRNKSVLPTVSGQVDTGGNAGGQIRQVRLPDVSGQVATGGSTNIDRSLDDREIQHPNKLIKNKKNKEIIKNTLSNNVSSRDNTQRGGIGSVGEEVMSFWEDLKKKIAESKDD